MSHSPHNMHTATAIHNQIKKAKKIMIVPHQNPDEDAIGSTTAFHEYVTNLGKPAVIFCATPPNSRLDFIPLKVRIECDPVLFKDKEIDTIVVLDSGDLRYAGIEQHLIDHPATIINIDHHATNEHFGHINLVSATSSSTSEILYRFLSSVGHKISKEVATSLLAGLAYDTMNFTNAATSGDALSTGGELIRLGGNFNLVTSKMLKNKTLDSLKLWGKALTRLHKDEKLGLTTTYITQKDFAELGIGEGESNGISNYLNNVEDTQITLLLVETSDHKVKGSFRTTKEGVDVSALAKKFNGGGHKKAAGFTTTGTIGSVLKSLGIEV